MSEIEQDNLLELLNHHLNSSYTLLCTIDHGKVVEQVEQIESKIKQLQNKLETKRTQFVLELHDKNKRLINNE